VTQSTKGGQHSRRSRSMIPRNLTLQYPMRRAGVKKATSRRPRRGDTLSPAERSTRMAKVRSKANRSTEARVAASLAAKGIRGWVRNAADIPGSPDFYFLGAKVAVFVDGCFWHGCPACDRRTPRTRRAFWRDKIESNRRRDRRVARRLRAEGCRVIRVWEHSIGENGWLDRVQRAVQAGTVGG